MDELGEMSLFYTYLFSGAKKRLRLLKLANSEKIKKAKYDPNVVGLEESSEEEDSSESEDDSEPEVIENGKEKIAETINLDNEINNESSEKETKDVSEKGDELKRNNITNSTEAKDEKNAAKDKSKQLTKGLGDKKIEVKKPPLEHPTIHIDVKRDPKIQVARLKLPILGEEQRIMELVNENEFLILAGETGKILLTTF